MNGVELDLELRGSPITKTKKPEFGLGEGVTALRCKMCGGNHFFVGKKPYCTAIKCVNCLWEGIIHSG